MANVYLEVVARRCGWVLDGWENSGVSPSRNRWALQLSTKSIFADGVWSATPDGLPWKCKYGDGGRVYVVQFSTETIKVGHGRSSRGRVNSHRQAAELHGVTIVQCWTSSAHASSWASETELIAWCAERGTPASGREYFDGLIFDEVVTFAATLATKVRPVDPEAAARSEAFLREAKAMLTGWHPNYFRKEKAITESVSDMTDDEMRAAARWRTRKAWVQRTQDRRQLAEEERIFLSLQG